MVNAVQVRDALDSEDNRPAWRSEHRVNAFDARHIRRFEECVSDLIALLALSQTWSGHSAANALRTIGDALLRMLHLNFVRREQDRAAPWDLRALNTLLYPCLSESASTTCGVIADPFNPGGLSIASIPLRACERVGTLIAAASRENFPNELQRLLLGVATNQACVALHKHVQVEAQRRAVTELHSHVARRTVALIETNRELHIGKDELAAEHRGLARLHEFSTRLLEMPDQQSVIELMLDAIIDLQHADFGMVQLDDPERNGLVIVAHRNFPPAFLNYFALVRECGTACGCAARGGGMVIIEDIQSDERFSAHRQIAAEAGFRAVQSTPLIGHRGNLLGVASTHFRDAHRPSDAQLRLTDLYVRHATQAIERKRAEEERSKLAAIVENSSDFIGIASLAGKPFFLNAAGRKLVGLPSDGSIPDDIRAYVVAEDLERLATQIMPAVEQAGFWDGEISFRHFGNGTEIPVLQHVFFIREPNTGDRLALATVCRDMTDRRRAQRAVSQAQQELAHATRVLGMGEITSSIAHEINQPLAAIAANGNACRHWIDRDAPNIKEALSSLDKIVRDANRASEIIQRIRASSTKVAPLRALLNLNEVINEVLAIMAHEIARDHVVLRSHLADWLPAVSADHIELQQVVLNLVINSIEAMRPVTGRPRHLLITSVHLQPAAIKVSVCDNGIGVAPQHLARLLEPMFTTKSQGMGLGLSISHRIVEAHGGKLLVTANEDSGLTSSFTLPTLEAHD
jgi:PAS domain S-box-containing protein